MYPAAGGPVTLAFYDPTGDVVACGEYKNSDYKECFIFDGITWEPLPLLQEYPYPYAYGTKSYFMEGIGLWVGGQPGKGEGTDEMVNELFNSDGQWEKLPVDSPYEFYAVPCIVPLNSTHIFFSGGHRHYTDTWIFDLESLVWTSSTPMLKPRNEHGCVLTNEGEVLIAGGSDGNVDVNIFNPVSLEWRESGNLPSEIATSLPGLRLWNGTVLLFEGETDRIWKREEDQGWQLMDVTMGGNFYAVWGNAVLVPDTWRNNCY